MSNRAIKAMTRIAAFILICSLVTTSLTGPIFAEDPTYTVIFFANGGLLDNGGFPAGELAQFPIEGQPASMPTDPTREGFEFTGWFMDPEPDYTHPWNFSDPVDQAAVEYVVDPDFDSDRTLVLYAGWASTELYTVTFDSRGGSNVPSQKVNKNQTAIAPVSPTMSRHSFNGWYTAGGQLFDFSTPITSDITLYASWSVDSYTVTFYSNGGDEVPGQYISYNGTAAEPPSPVKTGFIFCGWYKEPACINAWDFNFDRVIDPTALYAKWEAAKFIVSFNSNGGGLVASQSVEYSKLATAPSDVKRKGFVLAGWYKDPEYSQPWSFGSDVVTQDILLHAKWIEKPADTAKPMVVTVPVSGKTQFEAVLNGGILDDGGSYIINSGFMWGIDSSNLKTVNVSVKSAAFSGLSYKLTGLKPDTVYYFKAFAENNTGIGYGDLITFKTPLKPTLAVSTTVASDISAYSAVLHGTVITGNSPVKQAGFLFSTDIDPNVTVNAKPASDGSIFYKLTGLKPGTTYYFQAFASDAAGQLTANTMSFTTTEKAPEVKTNPALLTKYNTLNLSGYITKNNGYKIIESGFLWGTSPDPENLALAVPGSDSRILSFTMERLQGGVTYYYQAFAINSAGTGYGEVLSITVPKTLPDVTTVTVGFDAERWTAGFTGYVFHDGGTPLTDYGFMFSKDQKTWVRLPGYWRYGMGLYDSGVSGKTDLPPGTYYVKAFAANSAGTAYGEAKSFTTPKLPKVVGSIDKTKIEANAAILSGRILDSGGEGVACTSRWFKYRLAGTNDWKAVNVEAGSFGTEEFIYKLTGLKIGTNYEFIAVAENPAGLSESSIISFTTTFGDTDKAAAANMKAMGFSARNIADILKSHFSDDSDACAQALQYAGYGAAEIALALKDSSYKSPSDIALKSLKSAGFNCEETAQAYLAVYDAYETYRHGKYDSNLTLASALAQAGYSVDDVTSVVKVLLQANITDAVYFLSKFPLDVRYGGIARIYGIDALAGWFWSGSHYGDIVLKSSSVINGLKSAGIDAAQILSALMKLNPSASIRDCARAFFLSNYKPKEAGPVLLESFSADGATLAGSLVNAGFNKTEIMDLMVYDMHLSAQEFAQIFTTCYGAVGYKEVPIPLISYYKPEAADFVKILYAAGWTEDYNGRGRKNDSSGLNEIVSNLWNTYGLKTPGSIISVLKEAGLSPMTVAQQMDRTYGYDKTLNYQQWTVRWLMAYRDNGYLSIDAAAWWKTRESSITRVISGLVSAGYSLRDLVLAAKNVYGLKAAEAVDHFTKVNKDYKTGWTDKNIRKIVEEIYNEDPLLTFVSSLKQAGSPANKTGNALMEKMGITDPEEMASYLDKAGYWENDVLYALVYNYSTNSSTLFGILDVMSKVMRNVYEQNPSDSANIGKMLQAAGYNNTSDAAWLLRRSNYKLYDIIRVLKELYGVTTIKAFDLLCNYYQNSDLISQLQAVYGTDPILNYVQFLKDSGNSASSAATYLKKIYGIWDTEKAANYLKKAGYSQQDVVIGIRSCFYNQVENKDVYLAIGKVLISVYKPDPLPKDPVAYVLKALNKDLNSVEGFLKKNGYSLKDTFIFLKDNYGLTSDQIIKDYDWKVKRADLEAALKAAFDEDYALLYIKKAKQDGAASETAIEMLTNFNIVDAEKAARYLIDAGYSEAEVLYAVWWKYRDAAVKVLKNVYMVTSIDGLSDHFKQDLISEYYLIDEITLQLQANFPSFNRAAIALLLRDCKYPIGPTGNGSIYSWLKNTPSGTRDESLASILGSVQPGDLKYDARSTAEILKHEGYNPEEIAKWLKKDKYPVKDIYIGLNSIDFDVNYKVNTLKLMRNLGIGVEELTDILINYDRMGVPEGYASWQFYKEALRYQRRAGFSLKEITNAYVRIGVPLKYLPYMLLLESSLIADEKHDPSLLLSAATIAEWEYNALAELPDSGDVISPIATGLLAIDDIQMVELWKPWPDVLLDETDIYYALRSVVGKAGSGWRDKLSSDKVEAVLDIINIAESLTGFNPFSSPREEDDILYNLLTIDALRSVGYDENDMAERLNDLDFDFLPAFVMMVGGGYDPGDAWFGIKSVTSYVLSIAKTAITMGLTQVFKLPQVVKLAMKVKTLLGAIRAIRSVM